MGPGKVSSQARKIRFGTATGKCKVEEGIVFLFRSSFLCEERRLKIGHVCFFFFPGHF